MNADLKKAAWNKFLAEGEVEFGAIREEVAASWKRCLQEHHLDPYASIQPIRLTQKEILCRCEKNHTLIEATKTFLNVLQLAVRNLGFILTLTDSDGYLLEVFGDEEIQRLAAATNFIPGCRRKEEDVAGTNSISLSLYLKKPVQITGAEHFNVNNHHWTCSTAPIFSLRNDFLGAVTLSGRAMEAHEHNLGMMIAAARAIENRIAEEDLSREKDNLNSYMDSLLNSVSEGIIAIRNDGEVTHINKVAESMLSIPRRAVIGKHLYKTVGIDPKFWKEFFENNKGADQELALTIAGKTDFFLLSTRPIEVDRTLIGKILILTAKQRVHDLINRFSGGYARFDFTDIIGQNAQFLKQVKLAKMAARNDSRVLLHGESGTGKELFAQAIHNESSRKFGPFVAVSCAAIPCELIESELFGYREGAFTGSRKGGQVGKFELADKGTLFLDEISSMPIGMQSKILRVLEDNEFFRLGDNKPRKVDVRIIAATNRDLLEEVRKGNFREDLYFRLCVLEISIPPLRDRLDDLPLLSKHILNRISSRIGRGPLEVSKDAFQALTSYSWPGNIRELGNYLERAAITCEEGIIKPEHLPERIFSRSILREHIDEDLSSLKAAEQLLIVKMLRQCNGNVSESARRLKISRTTLHRRLKELKILSHAL